MYMENPLAFVAGAERSYVDGVSISDRKARGQFFTPEEVARLMASFLEFDSKQETLRVLDAGAGLGVLSAALCERFKKLRKKRKIWIDAFETDGSNAPKVPNVSQASMVSEDTQCGSDFTVNAVKKPSEIDGEAVLTRPKGHYTSVRSVPRESELRASQNRRLSGHKILGRKIRLNHWAYAASEDHRDTSGSFGEKYPTDTGLGEHRRVGASARRCVLPRTG